MLERTLAFVKQSAVQSLVLLMLGMYVLGHLAATCFASKVSLPAIVLIAAILLTAYMIKTFVTLMTREIYEIRHGNDRDSDLDLRSS